ncbi:hypothetical protein ACTAZI_01415 [Legionella bozemanae]|uniref:hypothetical protein n=1 Tax=Legionella bozemanae TaxID=447 RepID=UPI003EED7C59
MSPCMFVFGFGYTANHLAQLGFEIVGTTHKTIKKVINDSSAATLISYELPNPDIEHYLSQSTHHFS